VNEHLQICGSKTKECPECGEWVKMMERDMHKKEGFCDAIAISKQELQEKESKKKLDDFHAQRLT
jgi:hypothetical protein